MLCGTPVAEIEAKLSKALSASLHVPAAERAIFIAQHLLGHEPRPEMPTIQKPDNFEGELTSLSALIKAAVNSASRRRDSEPIQSIADYLVLHCTSDEELLMVIDEEEKEANTSSSLSSALANAGAGKSSSQKATPKNLSALKSLVGARRRSSVSAARTVLGRSASTVLPAVIGAFQEEAAKKAAKAIDQSIIDAAMKAGTGFKFDDPEEEVASSPKRVPRRR